MSGISPPGLKLLETVECERRPGEDNLLDVAKRVLLTEALWSERGNCTAAAERLGISPMTYHTPTNRAIVDAARETFGAPHSGPNAAKARKKLAGRYNKVLAIARAAR